MNDFKNIFSNLREQIEDLKTIDCHTHINIETPLSSGSYDIVMYHYIVTELLSAGVPSSVIKESCENLSILVPYLAKIDNTNTFKTLIHIINDLFGVTVTIDKTTNWQELNSNIIRTNASPQRLKELQKEISHIEKSILTSSIFDFHKNYDKDIFVDSVRIESLLYDIMSNEILERLEKLGHPIRRLKDVLDTIENILDTLKLKEIRIIGLDIPPDFIYEDVNFGVAESVFSRCLRNGKTIGEEEKNIIAVYMLNEVLKQIAGRDFVIQVFYGIKRPVAGNLSLVHFASESILSLSTIFERYKNLNFEILIATPYVLHNVSVLSKCFPNVFVNCNWWHVNYPHYLKMFISERIEILPKVKINGFYSDAYNMEWSYGKLKTFKDNLSEVLTWKVVTGYFSEKESVEFARDILYVNPQNFYRL